MYCIRSKVIAKGQRSQRRGAWAHRRSPSQLADATTGVALLIAVLVIASNSSGAVAASPAEPAADYVTLSGSPGMPELDRLTTRSTCRSSAPRATARPMHPVSRRHRGRGDLQCRRWVGLSRGGDRPRGRPARCRGRPDDRHGVRDEQRDEQPVKRQQHDRPARRPDLQRHGHERLPPRCGDDRARRQCLHRCRRRLRRGRPRRGPAREAHTRDTETCNGFVTTGCAERFPTAFVGRSPRLVALDAQTGMLYVTNHASADVSVLNTALGNAQEPAGCAHPVPEVNVGSQPNGLAIDELTSTVYVLSLGTGTMSLLGGG